MLAKVRKRHHICQVNELVKEKLEHKAAKSTAINGCPVSFLFPSYCLWYDTRTLSSLSSTFGDESSGHIFGYLNSVANPLVYF